MVFMNISRCSEQINLFINRLPSGPQSIRILKLRMTQFMRVGWFAVSILVWNFILTGKSKFYFKIFLQADILRREQISEYVNENHNFTPGGVGKRSSYFRLRHGYEQLSLEI